MKNGYLRLIIGPMFSGKTSHLINVYHNFSNKYADQNINILVINYDLDKRYSDNSLSNHDGVCIPCTFCKELNDIDEKSVEEAHIILINEGQFFIDIYDKVKHWVDILKKKVYVAALDGDFKREPFGKFLHLIPICDEIVKLSSKCNNCDLNNALFSYRTSDEKDKIVIGGNNKYIPLCRNCYLSKHN